MARDGLKRLLQQWFLEEVGAAPDADPRQTADCLHFGEIDAYAAQTLALDARRTAHVSSCAWCQRSVALLHRLRVDDDQDETPPAAVTDGPSGDLSGWITHLSNTAGSIEAPSAGAASARFDDDGTLRVQWRDVPFEGRARMQVVFEGTSITLARGEVRNGEFIASAPHPELGIRGVELPRESLRLESEENDG